jgi:hypothetical protein
MYDVIMATYQKKKKNDVIMASRMSFRFFAFEFSLLVCQ